MRFGLDVAQQRLDWSQIVDRVRLAEALGFEGIWGFDHFKPMYGEGPGNCFEGMTTLAALATLTTRVRLGLLVTGVTYRHPSVLTAEAITVDHVSGGRLDLALGASWFGEEHEELGIDFPEVGRRVDRLQDTVEIVRRLTTGETVSYTGITTSLTGARMHPLPVQRPHPPIWIGASGMQRMLPLAGRLADVWHGFGDPETLAKRWAVVERAAKQAGRAPGLPVRASSLSIEGDLQAVERALAAHERLGTAYLVCGWPEGGEAQVEAFARRFVGSGRD